MLNFSEEEKKARAIISRKKWVKNHRKEVSEYQRKWQNTHSARQKEYRKKYYAKYPWLRTLNHIKSRCSNKNTRYCKRGIKCFITPDEIKSLWFRDEAFKLKKPSIDRIDNNGNYILENCRFIEFSLNSSLGGKMGSKMNKED
jgi:phenolic acid decarboxylase